MTRAGYKPKEKMPEQPDKRQKPRKPHRKVNGAAVFSCVFFLTAAVIAAGVVMVWRYTEPYTNAFLPGITLMGHSLEGMSPEEGIALLTSLTQERVQRWQAEAAWDEETYTITGEEIGLAVDADATLAPLWEIGREESMIKRLRAVLEARMHPVEGKLAVTFREQPIREMLARLAENIDCDPADAKVTFSPNSAEPFRFEDEREGYRLDTEPLLAEIRDGALTLESVYLKAEPAVLEPGLTVEQLENAITLRGRIVSQLDEGAAGANELLALSGLEGRMIRPGERFSFNEIIGTRTAEAGYQAAPEPAYDPLAEGIGGGVSRVATMLYQAAVLGDVEVAARSAASYPTPYSPAGQEATVSDLGLDLVLNNNTPAPLWIHVRSWTEKEQTFAEVQIIGIPLEGSVRLETETTETPAPLVPVYIRDKEARYVTYTDEQEPVSAARPGVDAVTWRIHLNAEGEEISREILSQDHYEAIPARIYVGATER